MQMLNFVSAALFVSLMVVSTQPYAELSTSSAPPQSSQSISTSMPNSSPSSSPVNSTTAPSAGMTTTTTTTNANSNVNTGPTAGTTNPPTTTTTTTPTQTPAQPAVQPTGTTSSGMNPVTDQNINAAFQAQVSTSSDLRTQSINATTQNGIVTLNGTVDTQAQADRAVGIAKSISGVNGVQSNLTVRNQ